MESRNFLAAGLVIFLAGLTPRAQAEVALHVFQPGERASAADFNNNFRNLKLAVESAERRNAELQNRIRDLEAALSNVRALNNVITVEGVNGVRTVRLTGVNLQVVNGLSRTESINGAGNIIVGYDEPNSFTTRPICSRASAVNGSLITDEAGCLAAGGVFSTQHKSGSHNLVLGTQNGYSSFGGIVAGRFNYINEIFASVVGGVDNRASGRFSAIVAGQGNVTQESAAILGGNGNQARARNSVIAGGSGNVASGEGASIAGGERNIASGRHATVAGGLVNTSSGTNSSILGGSGRTLAGSNTTQP
jgi:hypothetical protein